MRKYRFDRILGAMALACLLSCTDTQPPLAGLAYSDPVPGKSQWALKKSVSSTPNHLVLDLVPPLDGGVGFGVGITLTLDPSKAIFTKVDRSDTELAQSGSYDLGSGLPFFKTAITDGDLLIGAYQKGLTTKPAPHDSGRVLSIALDPSLPLVVGPVPLRVKSAKELRIEGMTSISVAIGILEVK